MLFFNYLSVMWRKNLCATGENLIEKQKDRNEGRDTDMEMEIKLKSEPHLRFKISLRPLLDQLVTPLNFLVIYTIKFHCLPQIF